MNNSLIYDLNAIELSRWLVDRDQPSFRLNQLLTGLFDKYYSDFSHFENIPQALRNSLTSTFIIDPLVVKNKLVSKDNLTEKTLFRLGDGSYIETVLMRYNSRNTLCISTQVGCSMGCVFCATGQMGFTRNLTSGEILSQIMYYQRMLHSQGESLTNVVYMGMGEPFLNYRETLRSLSILTDTNCVHFGSRRITISTVGIIPKILQFSEEGMQVNLAVSLHAPNDSLRSKLVPANRIYPIKPLIAACKEYTGITHRRISFEYALISGENDSTELALELAKLLKGMLCHVNLIPLNPSKDYPVMGSSKEKVHLFNNVLLENGIKTTIRLRRGIDIQAGCGQLAGAFQQESENIQG